MLTSGERIDNKGIELRNIYERRNVGCLARVDHLSNSWSSRFQTVYLVFLSASYYGYNLKVHNNLVIGRIVTRTSNSSCRMMSKIDTDCKFQLDTANVSIHETGIHLEMQVAKACSQRSVASTWFVECILLFLEPWNPVFGFGFGHWIALCCCPHALLRVWSILDSLFIRNIVLYTTFILHIKVLFVRFSLFQSPKIWSVGVRIFTTIERHISH